MGDKPYGNVRYADPGYQADGKARYPIDTEAHARAAWSYINHADNAAKYTADQLRRIKGRIASALEKYGAHVERRFDPSQPRDGDGRWTDGLADVINLGARQRLVASSRFRAGRGSYGTSEERQPMAAVVEGTHGREVRLGIVGNDDEGEAGAWDASGDRDDTTTLNRRGLRKLRNDLDDAQKKAKADAKRFAGDNYDPDNPLATGAEPVASGETGGVSWSIHLEDDDSYSTAVRVDQAEDAESLVLDAKQLARFLKWLDELDQRVETARSHTPKPKPRLFAALVRAFETGVAVRQPLLYDRSFPLDDIQIQRSGDGRTVEAYAAVFASPYEVRDQHGHYMEVIDRAAFNRTLNGAGRNAMCLYNHGMTVHGTPSEMGSVPLGTPTEIRADGRGLLTVTRYNRGPFADQVLEAIRNGDIKAQSFRGGIYKSDPPGKLPRRRYGDSLPTVTRFELGLTDYGPTPIPVNQGAEIVAVRSVQELLAELRELDADEREELLRSIDFESTPDGDPDPDEEDPDNGDEVDDLEETATSDDSEPGAEDPPAERSATHSGRLDTRRAIVLRGWTSREVSRA